MDLEDRTEPNIRSILRATIAPGYLAVKNHGRAEKTSTLKKEEERLLIPTIENFGYKSVYLNRLRGTENKQEFEDLLVLCCTITAINMAESLKAEVEGMDEEAEGPILEAVNRALDAHGNEVLLATQMYKVEL